MRKFSLKNFHEWPDFFRAIIIIVICAAVIYFVYWWDISALLAQRTDYQQKSLDISDQLTSVIRKQLSAQEDIAHFGQLQELYAQWQKKIPTQHNLPAVINEILKIGTYNSLHFNSFDPGVEIKENGYVKTPIKIIAVGNYHQLASFVSQIANMPFVVYVGDFSISNLQKSDGASNAGQINSLEGRSLTAELNLEVYSLAEKSELK